MKPGSHFKLSKRNKTLTALLPFADADSRHFFRKAMIQAQLQGEVKIKAEPRKSYVTVATGTPATA